MTTMVRKRVAELEGAQLDWAVAKAESKGSRYQDSSEWAAGYVEWNSPSSKWEDGGPIIEREQIHLDPVTRRRENCDWQAQVWTPFAVAYGPTPLIAAMRAFVASKLGDEVEVPV